MNEPLLPSDEDLDGHLEERDNADHPPDLSGRTLAGYTILRRLGQGGMATVYLATQDSLERRVAFKVLKPSLARDASYVRRFHNEAKSVAELAHPNIVQVYEVGEHGGFHFIAQEYVAGSSLKQRLQREGSLSVERALEIVAAAASALDKAAAAGIIHRDIKPDNILLGTDGSVKVADFGLARRRDPSGLELTQAGMTWGTPLYMSPEQINGQTLDGRSDIYSLGVTAYHALAGRPPFEGETPMSVAMQHVNQPAEPLNQIRPQIPMDVSQLIDRMMAKSPADRPSSGGEVLELLDAGYGGLGRTNFAHTALRGSAATQLLDQAIAAQAKPKRSSWRLPGAVAAFAMGAVFAALLFGRDPLRPTRAEALAVPQQVSAEKQFFYAVHANSEASWQAILEYFPAVDREGQTNEVHRLYNLRAKQQLVRLYIEQGRPRDARPLINELAALGDTDRQFQLFGRAWQVILATALGESERASEVLTGIWDDREELDRATRSQLQRARRQLLAR